jgi:hypothetical protein
MKNTISTSQELVGKFINRYLWTDIQPIGKIVGIKSKTTVFVQKVVASENKVKMEFIPGGFSVHCTNDSSQEYDFIETNEIMEIRLSKQYLKSHGIDERPRNYYDYNF